MQVHRVVMHAAELVGTPRVWQATVDRDLLLRGAQSTPRGSRLIDIPVGVLAWWWRRRRSAPGAARR
ncbi:MAG: hypothetical protein QOG96_6931 [Pseudonocardiales bacterium]|nr:hypothetical protein [Pseudonocardiales bacterium]